MSVNGVSPFKTQSGRFNIDINALKSLNEIVFDVVPQKKKKKKKKKLRKNSETVICQPESRFEPFYNLAT